MIYFLENNVNVGTNGDKIEYIKQQENMMSVSSSYSSSSSFLLIIW